MQICHRDACFAEPRRHKVTESRDNSIFVPSGGTDLWEIYGGVKGGNPVSTLDRVCNGLKSWYDKWVKSLVNRFDGYKLRSEKHASDLEAGESFFCIGG